MSNVHRWPLSQTANKAQGTCCVCFQVHQLHLKDNTLHLHGPRTSRCSGSNRPPLAARNPGLGPIVFPGPSPSPAAIGQSSSRRLSSTASRGTKLVVTPSRIAAPGSLSLASPQNSAVRVSQAPPASQLSQDQQSVSRRAIKHPKPTGPILKHIPRSARPACCSALESILNSIARNSSDVTASDRLLNFAADVLHETENS